MDGLIAFYLVCLVIALFGFIFVVPAARELRENKNKNKK
jgi:hypothetical protein